MIEMEDHYELERENMISDSKSAVDNEPIKWFDELYNRADGDSQMIPWAKMVPNPIMMQWVRDNHIKGKALIVGCGLGDDAIGLEKLGFDVTAFDISEHCIKWCKNRFEKSSVKWQVADILEPPISWINQFDLVVEIHILQAIPDGGIRETAAENLPRLLNNGGELLCIGRLDDGEQTIIPPPWPLKKEWLIQSFNQLKLMQFELFSYPETKEVTRYYASWKKENIN